jgi:hypothetical protein
MTEKDAETTAGKKSNSLFWAAGALLALTLGLSVYFNFKGYFEPQVIATLPVDSRCDLRAGDCQSKRPQGGTISLSIKPRSIPLLKPLELHVSIENIQTSAIEVDFVGVGMNMGYNRPRLNKITAGEFTGEATLPVCVRRKMNWEARVLVHTPEGIVMAPFQFYTLR